MSTPQIELIVDLAEEDGQKWGLSRTSISSHIKGRVSALGVQISDADARSGNGLVLATSINLLQDAFSVNVSFMRDVGYNCGTKESPIICWVMGSVWNEGSLGVSSTNSGGRVLATLDDHLDSFLRDLVKTNKAQQ